MNKKFPPVLCIVGWAKSGKTTLIEKLVAHFAGQGKRVATIKHHVHASELDTPGKDSWRHYRAGSACTVVAGPTQIAAFTRNSHDLTLKDIILKNVKDADIVLVEGFKQESFPKIEIVPPERKTLVREGDPYLIGVACDNQIQTALPVFSRDAVKQIGTFIMEKLSDNPLPEPEDLDIELKINGKTIGMNPFVKTIISRTLIAMVSSLRGGDDVEQISIDMKMKDGQRKNI